MRLRYKGEIVGWQSVELPMLEQELELPEFLPCSSRRYPMGIKTKWKHSKLQMIDGIQLYLSGPHTANVRMNCKDHNTSSPYQHHVHQDFTRRFS